MQQQRTVESIMIRTVMSTHNQPCKVANSHICSAQLIESHGFHKVIVLGTWECMVQAACSFSSNSLGMSAT